jgi:hypothetical protein
MSETPRTNEFKRTVGVPWWEFAGQLERELAASQAGQANALELLREIRDDEVNAQDEADKFLRDHQPSKLSEWQAEAARLSAEREHNANLAGMWQALAEGLASRLNLWHNAAGNSCNVQDAAALAAYEAAKAGQPAKKPAASLDEPPGPA